MEPWSIASIASIAGKLALTEATKAGLAGMKNHFQPDEMTRVLKKAIESAEAVQSPTGGIFSRCYVGGPQGTQKFLDAFFSEGEVLRTLQKPLQDQDKPDIAILLAAFEKLAPEHPEAQNYLPALLRPWMETFIESYFEEIKGICFKVAKAQYLEQLAQRVKKVQFVGMAVSDSDIEQPETLAQIFVMPDVREERSRNSSQVSVTINGQSAYHMNLSGKESPRVKELNRLIKQNDLVKEQKEWAIRDRSSPRIPAQKVINLTQKKAVILGAPGSGKTMLASYFALMLCETPQSDPTQIGLKAEDYYLPVVVRIRDWILESKMGLLEYLRSNAEANLACKELPAGFFEHWLERGRALILLDGLDEVVDEAQRRKVAEQIETFLHQYQDNPAVITSRAAGYRWDFFNLDEFPHYMLESFDDKQVATFIDHWYDSRLKDDKAQAERRKVDLQKAFARNERIRLLAKNPLLLTIITLIHRYQAELPRQRCKLYEKAVETLLTSWDIGKEIKWNTDTLHYLKQDDLLYLLKKLAYWIHSQGSAGENEGGTIIKENDLIEQLRKEIQPRKKCEFDEAEKEAKRFIEFIRKRTGLLNEQGVERYAFVHKTFQEYLTAEEIYSRHKREDNTEIIWSHFRDHLHDQHWREVLLLLVSKLEGHQARKAIQTVLDAKSEYEKWLHRDLLFAGWCLTEDPPELTVVAQEWVGEILDRLVDLEVGDSEQIGGKIKSEVAKILHCFGKTTIEQDVWAKLQAQEDVIDRFRLLEFQAALGQEAEVIDTLLSLLGDNNLNVCRSAARELGQLGNSSPEVVNGLLSLLDDEKSILRRSAIQALGQLGNSSPEVVSRLLSLLDDKEWDVRFSAAQALGQLENSNPKVVSRLLSLLNDKEWDVCSSAAEVLGQLGNSSPEVVSRLLSLLDDKEWDVRFSAAQALGRLGNSSPEVVSRLLFLLDDKELYVRSSAAQALVQLGNSSPEVVNGLLSLLDDEELILRRSAIQALGQLENSTPEVVNSLRHRLNDYDSGVRASAAAALVNLGNSSPEVVNSLLDCLNDENSGVRSGAAAVLGGLAKTSDTIRPKVVQWLEQNPNHDGFGKAIDCLWSIVVE